MKKNKKMKCKHSPKRLYSWFVKDCLGESLYIGCCECGEIWEKKWLKKPLKWQY